MDKYRKKRVARYQRHERVTKKIQGSPEIPRLCVFRSLNHIYAQLIDDIQGKVLFSVSSLKLTKKEKEDKKEISKQVGKMLAEKALQNDISTVVFDRGGYKYHGRIKAFAEGAREGGLKF
ncbi:MAG: 50S ribosomal protein L18 [bacterium]